MNLNVIKVPAIAPYALDVLASGLSADGHEVEVLDLCQADNPVQTLKARLTAGQPDLLALSMRNAFDLYFPSMFHLADKGSFLRSHAALIAAAMQCIDVERMVIGGVGFSLNPYAFLQRFGLRYGARGPGEHILVRIARQLAAGRTVSEMAGGAPRFVFDGRGGAGPAAVSRGHVDNAWYYEFGGQAAVRTTTGCAMRCSYCAEPVAVGGSYRQAAIENTLREIDQLVSLGVRDIQTADSEFNMPLAHSKMLLDAIIDRQYGRDLRLWLYCQPRPFDQAYAAKLAAAGVVGINFGSDHTDPDILDGLGKWYRKEHVADASRYCAEYGIEVMHELLFGSPGDTPDKMFRAIEEVLSMAPRVIGVTVGLGVAPGTPLGRLLEEQLQRDAVQPGFYLAGEPLVDPTFYVDPAFAVPEVFESLQRVVGSDADRVMLPALDSTSTTNNQLVNSERVSQQVLIEKRKGPPWYHFPGSVTPKEQQ